jgi:Zn-dependent alcohol dehydrogenase
MWRSASCAQPGADRPARQRYLPHRSGRPSRRLPQLAELWRQGRFPIDRLVSTFRFDEINGAVAALEAGDVIKPVVLFD